MTLAVVKTIEATFENTFTEHYQSIWISHDQGVYHIMLTAACDCYVGDHSGDTQLGGRF